VKIVRDAMELEPSVMKSPALFVQTQQREIAAATNMAACEVAQTVSQVLGPLGANIIISMFTPIAAVCPQPQQYY
jgi:hypothetical protein